MSSDARPITLMTYNIKNPDDWPGRLPVILYIIRRHDPDVLCLQEAFDHQVGNLHAGRRTTPSRGRVMRAARPASTSPCSSAATDCGRWRRLFWLSDTPDEPVSNTWGSLFPRIAHHVRLVDVDGPAFTLLTTHFGHKPGEHGDEVRGKSAALIVERLAPVDGPVVVAGDCNEPAGQGRPACSARPAMSTRGGAPATPTTARRRSTTGNPPVDTGERIDWVLTKDVTGVDRVVIDHDGPETWFASDHFAVVAKPRP